MSMVSGRKDEREGQARAILVVGIVFAGLAVALGAFAAHGLKSVLSPEALVVFETGVRYQMYHGLALLALGSVSHLARRPHWVYRGGLLLALGVLVFSGSLYAYALTGIRGLGLITPFGGISFLAGWMTAGLGFVLQSGEGLPPGTV